MKKELLKKVVLIVAPLLLAAAAIPWGAAWFMSRRSTMVLDQWYDPALYLSLLDRQWPRTRFLLRLTGQRTEACRLGAAMTAAAHPWLSLEPDLPPPSWKNTALSLAREAAEDCRRADDEAAGRRQLLIRGYLSAWNGESPAAQRFFGQAQQQAKEAKDVESEWATLLALARWQDLFGKTAAAVEAYSQVREFDLLKLPEYDSVLAAVRFEEGLMDRRRGLTQQAMTACLESMQLIESGRREYDPKRAFLHEQLAGVYLQAERADLAVQHYQKAATMLDELQATNSEKARIGVGLGRALLRNGDTTGGLARLQTSVDVLRQSGETARPRLVLAWRELAAGYRQTGQNEQARDAYREALTSAETLFPADSRWIVDTRQALDEVLSAIDHPEKDQQATDTAVEP